MHDPLAVQFGVQKSGVGKAIFNRGTNEFGRGTIFGVANIFRNRGKQNFAENLEKEVVNAKGPKGP